MFLSPLIAFSLVFTVAASLSAESIVANHELTSANFSDSIKNGVWFVNFGTPRCHHCKLFAPTWERVVAYVDDQRDPDISLAQVNCLAHGDICKQQNIYAYPSLFIYEDGHKIGEFKQRREYERLTTFIDAHARKAAPFNMATLDPSPPIPQRSMHSIGFKYIDGPGSTLHSVPSVSPSIASDSGSDQKGEAIIYDLEEVVAEPVRVMRIFFPSSTLVRELEKEGSPALPELETQEVFSVRHP